MFRLSIHGYSILIADHLPSGFASDLEHATIIDQFASTHPDDSEDLLYLAVRRDRDRWPFLISTQQYTPGPNAGFIPGVLLVPETSLLLVGAGVRLLAYHLDQPAKLWEDRADVGFGGWERYQDVIIMSAELELAVWTLQGEKLWSTYVEPPWDYRLDGMTIHIEVLEVTASFPLRAGPGTVNCWWM